MIARGFRSVIWVGAVGGAALSCYMVSLRVATERADLARVEHRIVDAKRDIRSLQTELGTRGRLTQLEDWNSNVLALSAPTTGQFARDAVQLAQLETRQTNVGEQSQQIRLAALDTSGATPAAPIQAVAAPTPAAPAVTPPAADKPSAKPRVVQAIAPVRLADPAMVRRASYEEDVPDTAVPSGKAPARTAKPAGTHAAAVRADPRKPKHRELAAADLRVERNGGGAAR